LRRAPDRRDRFRVEWERGGPAGRFSVLGQKNSISASSLRADCKSFALLLTTGPRLTGHDHGSATLARLETQRS
jgi:hypothetical protein